MPCSLLKKKNLNLKPLDFSITVIWRYMVYLEHLKQQWAPYIQHLPCTSTRIHVNKHEHLWRCLPAQIALSPGSLLGHVTMVTQPWNNIENTFTLSTETKRNVIDAAAELPLLSSTIAFCISLSSLLLWTSTHTLSTTHTHPRNCSIK